LGIKPDSVEFRQKIIEVHEREDVSIRKLGQGFAVGKSFIPTLLKQPRETGDINPQSQGGTPPSKLQEKPLLTLTEIIEQNHNATLEK
jgi:transposase